MILMVALLVSCFGIVNANGTNTALEIDPTTVTVGELGEVFSVNMTVLDVAELYGWESKLGYDTNKLNVESVNVGLFGISRLRITRVKGVFLAGNVAW